MTRLIDADGLKNTVKCTLVSWGAQGVLIDEMLKTIDNAPTVPLPNEQTAWEQGYEAGLAQGKHERHCGADMRGGAEQ